MTLHDLEALSMTELIHLQGRVLEALRRRFERPLALVFTDVVGSTAYFARYGDVAGRSLQQLHFDLLSRALPVGNGRIVDTAGDGAFTVFSSVDFAVDAVSKLLLAVSEANEQRQHDHHLGIRVGVHFGPVLTDGVQVTGDAVNLASRVASTADPGGVRVTRAAFGELGGRWRVRCRAIAPVELKGIAHPVELFALEWRDPTVFPTRVRIVETNEEHALPAKDTITFGRLKEHDGRIANDIVLWHPDVQATMRLSRWHFELRRTPNRMMLRAVSDQMTEVDDQPVARGTEVPVGPNSVIRVARVLTLQLSSDARNSIPGEEDPRAAGTLGFTVDQRRG
ncbi:MAG: adenylate/guanylate cyclase domain-containing protein [Myxococcales bacterium]|nr:adenylate/guanylate cyclase domain-containing protein [Myxococcales bacterium]